MLFSYAYRLRVWKGSPPPSIHRRFSPAGISGQHRGSARGAPCGRGDAILRATPARQRQRAERVRGQTDDRDARLRKRLCRPDQGRERLPPRVAQRGGIHRRRLYAGGRLAATAFLRSCHGDRRPPTLLSTSDCLPSSAADARTLTAYRSWSSRKMASILRLVTASACTSPRRS